MAWEKVKLVEHWAIDNLISLIASFIALLLHSLANRLWKSKLNTEVSQMFEKTELEGNIGKIGTYSVDVTEDLHLKLAVGVDLPIIEYLKQLAIKTDTPIDDKAIEWIESILAKPVV